MTTFPLQDVPKARSENIPFLRKEVAHNLSRDIAYRIMDTKTYLENQRASLYVKHIDKYLDKHPDRIEDVLDRMGMFDNTRSEKYNEIIEDVSQLQF